MADPAEIRDAPGVCRQEWGPYAVRFTGTREALIAAGIVTDASLFANGSERNKWGRTVRTKRFRIDERDCHVEWRRERGNLYVAHIERTKEENARLLAERKAPAGGGGWLYAPRPNQLTAQGIREMAEGSFKGAMMAMAYTFNLLNEPDVPYTFDQETRDAAEEHCRALYVLFQRGKLTPKLGALARADDDFQRFMQTAITKPSRARRKVRERGKGA